MLKRIDIQYILFIATLIFWFNNIIPYVKLIMGFNPPVFPIKVYSAYRLKMFVFTSILLSGFLCFFGMKELKLKQDQVTRNARKKIFPIAIFLFFSLPLAYAYMYELDLNNITQTILDQALMDEDFDDLPPGSNPPEWNPVDGNWTTVFDNGTIVYYQDDDSDKEALSISTTGNVSWANYTYEVDVKFVEGNTKKDDRGALLLYRFQGGNSYYFLWMKEYQDVLELHNHGDGAHMVTSTSCTLVPDVWYHVTITIMGQTVDVTIDDTPYFTGIDLNGALDTGNVAIGTSYYKVMFDNIYVEEK